MKNLFLLLCLLILGTSLSAQKELTLEDAILKRWTDLAPDNIPGMQWVAFSKEYSYYSDDRQSLYKGSLEGKENLKIASASELNTAFDLKLRGMPRINWLFPDQFYFQSGSTYYKYNTSTKKGEKLVELPKGAANMDYDKSSGIVAYTIDNNLYVAESSNNKIAVTNSNDPNIVAGQAIARYEFGIGKGTFWSPKANFLAFYQKDETNVADYPLLDISTTPGTLKTVKYPMAGQKSEHASIGIHNMRTHETVYLDVEGPKDQYLTNLAWGPNEQFVYVAVVNREQNHMWLNKYDCQTGKLVKTLFEEKHSKYVEPENPVYFPNPTPNEFLWMSERDGFMHIYKYDTEGKMLMQLTKGNFVVKKILGLSRSGKNLIIVAKDETGLNQYAHAVELATGKMTKLSENSGIHNYQLSDDGMFLTDVYSSLKTPGVTDIINTRGKKVKTLVAGTNPMRDYKVGKPELVELKADDGTPLHARVIKPSNFDSRKKYPVLVYVYGGPHAQMVTNSYLAGAPLWMYHFAEKGYIIFTLDNRGSADRGFKFENIIHRNLGDVEMKDQLVGVDYLKSLPYVDGNRMAVHGWSYGGFMTTSLMLREADVFKVGVAGGPVTDWKYYEIMYGERYMDRPEENPVGYEKASLLMHADKLEGDLLLIHGTVDDVVVMQHNLALVRRFVEEGILIDFMPYPMHPHNVRGKDRIHLMNKVLTYVEEKLAKHAPPPVPVYDSTKKKDKKRSKKMKDAIGADRQ